MTFLFKTFMKTLVLATLAMAESTVTVLNNDNWDLQTKGKTLWVKFCTQSCDHCKKMHIAWERLGDTWADNEDVLIGKVDCDVEEALCNRFHVTGTPTLLYGDPLTLKNEYGGDKDYTSLNLWAKEVLIPICSPDNERPCSDLEKKWIGDWMKMSSSEIQNMIDNKESEEEHAHQKFETEFAKLQSIYDSANNEFILEKAKITRDIKLMRDCQEAVEKA